MSRKYLQNKRAAKHEKNQERDPVRKWLDDVNKVKNEYDEIKDDSCSSDDEKFKEQADLKELQRPLKKLL